MVAAQEARLRPFRRTFDGRFGGRDMALQFIEMLLDADIPPERIQVTESSYCGGNPSSDSVMVTVWYFSFGEVK